MIAASPFHGEGHRKIWARLRAQGLRTSKHRTLAVMRTAAVLGPARLPTPVGARPHDGTIVETKGGNHKLLKAWKVKCGAEQVESWLVK